MISVTRLAQFHTEVHLPSPCKPHTPFGSPDLEICTSVPVFPLQLFVASTHRGDINHIIPEETAGESIYSAREVAQFPGLCFRHKPGVGRLKPCIAKQSMSSGHR